MASSATQIGWADLLTSAVTTPGTISRAYAAFHNYSFGNQLLAWSQCAQREIPLGPMATFPKWKELGRHVKKGEKAIMLCQPVTVRRTGGADAADDSDDVIVRFVYRNAWFVLAQTDGADLQSAEIPGWDKSTALSALSVTEVPFECQNGNVMGYARKREIAISPLCPFGHKTLFHELAHVLLGHTAEGKHADSDTTPRDLREVEAESVALLCCEALSLAGADHCRAYIQGWWGLGNAIPEKSTQRILRVADLVVRAGRASGPSAREDKEGM